MQTSPPQARRPLLSTGRRGGAAVGWTIGVGLAALLIVLIWAATLRSIGAERAATERHASAETRAHAVILADLLGQQVRGIDQTLRGLAAEWRRDPGRFDLAAWRRGALLLPQDAQLFLIDASGIARQSTLAADVGRDFVSRDYFRHFMAAPDADAPLFVGQAQRNELHAPGQPAGWHVNFVRPLIGRNGRFSGVVDLSLSNRRLLGSAGLGELGPHGVVALVGTADGQLRASIGDLPASALGRAMDGHILAALRSSASGEGVGRLMPSRPLLRYAYQKVPGQDLAVVVGIDSAWLLHDVGRWAQVTRGFGLAITVLVLFGAVVGFGEMRAMQRRAQRLGRERALLASANASLAAAKGRADAKTAQLEGLLGGMADGVLLLDADLRVLAWNRQLSAIAGIPPEVLRVHEPIETLLRAQAEGGEFGHGDPEAQVAERLELLRSGGAFGRFERMRPNGGCIETRRQRLPNGGSVTLFTDITGHKRTEDALREARAAAEAAAASKSRFVAMVSHELRTPLHALLNGLTLMEQAPRQIPAPTVLAGMRQSGDALVRLLEDILDVSRMEAGRLSLEPELFDPRERLERALAMLRPIAATRGVGLRLDVAPDVPAQVCADPARMQQVVVNLLSNAAKFAPPGEVLLRAECAAGPSGPVMRVTVSDHGPDLAPAQRALLFRPFSRLPQSGQAPGGEAPAGIGLGLSICHDLVTLMGGEIGCAAAPAGGNQFWFTLPLRPAAARAPVAAAPALPGAWGRPLLPRLRVLLAEDVPGSRLVTAAMLRRSGHAVTTVADGAAAVVAAGGAPFDVVIMDVHLPGLDGVEATRRIHALSGTAGTVPVIGLTGEADPERAAACREAGMLEVIVKPAGRAELLAAIARHVPAAIPHRPAETDAGAGLLGAKAAAEAGPAGASPPHPEPVQAWDDAMLSARRLAELRDNLAPATLAAVAEECLVGLADMMRQLRDALAAGDVPAAWASAHAMAGLAGSYGLVALERRLRAVMRDLRAGLLADAVAAGGELEAELARSAAGLRAALQIETV